MVKEKMSVSTKQEGTVFVAIVRDVHEQKHVIGESIFQVCFEARTAAGIDSERAGEWEMSGGVDGKLFLEQADKSIVVSEENV